ncbi:unnamed protein product [Polarella glacialis]|uniref:Alpha-carbonic anhydrase domain-containing protein n=1 Tax=Polarella glacialis TaxID=89957 RepID=A0A813KJK0_POLGL|nr:unnamed protein product [Polarella glacialis]
MTRFRKVPCHLCLCLCIVSMNWIGTAQGTIPSQSTWTYVDQRSWALLPGSFCSLESQQSPIDIGAGQLSYPVTMELTQNPGEMTLGPVAWTFPNPSINISLKAGPLTWTIDIPPTFEGSSVTTYKGTRYALESITFKSPSEHTVEGVHADLEVQLNHVSPAGQPASLVTSVMMRAKNNVPNHEFLDQVWSQFDVNSESFAFVENPYLGLFPEVLKLPQLHLEATSVANRLGRGLTWPRPLGPGRVGRKLHSSMAGPGETMTNELRLAYTRGGLQIWLTPPTGVVEMCALDDLFLNCEIWLLDLAPRFGSEIGLPDLGSLGNYHSVIIKAMEGAGKSRSSYGKNALKPAEHTDQHMEDRFFANWSPLPTLKLNDYEYHETQLQIFEQIALNVNDNINSIIDDYRISRDLTHGPDTSPFRELRQTFNADPNHDSPILPRIRVRPNILVTTAKTLHSEKWNAATTLHSLYNLGPQFRCESLNILEKENHAEIATWIDYKVAHVATNFAFYLAATDVSYDIFACSHPWTAAILQKAAPPGAWLADALHTAMISFWLPG